MRQGITIDKNIMRQGIMWKHTFQNYHETMDFGKIFMRQGILLGNFLCDRVQGLERFATHPRHFPSQVAPPPKTAPINLDKNAREKRFTFIFSLISNQMTLYGRFPTCMAESLPLHANRMILLLKENMTTAKLDVLPAPFLSGPD